MSSPEFVQKSNADLFLGCAGSCYVPTSEYLKKVEKAVGRKDFDEFLRSVFRAT